MMTSNGIMKEEKHSCDGETCKESIDEIEALILRVNGETNGNALIKKIKATPEQYLDDERPIVVELATILIEDKLSSLTMKELYKEMKSLQKENKDLSDKVNKLEEMVSQLQTKQHKMKHLAPDQWPDVIKCNCDRWGISFFYIVHQKHSNGFTYYRMPGGGHSIKYINGAYNSKDSSLPKSDCDNKSIDQLKKEGKAFNLLVV